MENDDELYRSRNKFEDRDFHSKTVRHTVRERLRTPNKFIFSQTQNNINIMFPILERLKNEWSTLTLQTTK